MIRRYSKVVQVGALQLGGCNPVVIQSMTNTKTTDRDATLHQINQLAEAGCGIVRIAVNNLDAVNNIPFFVNNSKVPIVADIHFDYKLAIASVVAGVHKIRINPGNIGGAEKLKAVIKICKERNVPIRVGINSGSLERELLQKYGAPNADALAESALNSVKLFEENDFDNIVLSIKSSDTGTMIEANKIVAAQCDYPLHLGVTETGAVELGKVKSAIGIGALLSQGIGDTVRVSLTESPLYEVTVAKDILKALKLTGGIDIISCPTCGRTEIDIIKLTQNLNDAIDGIKTDKRITVAVMGCVVNGPGEARDADFGIAGGKGEAVLFRKGKVLKKVKERDIIKELIKELKVLLDGGQNV